MIKVGTLQRRKEGDRIYLRWFDPINGKEVRKSTKTTDPDVAERIRQKTQQELNNGKYFDFTNQVKTILMTNEEKIRKYMAVLDEETEKAKERLSSKKKGGEAGAIAASKVGIGRGTGRMGKRIIDEADRLIASGDIEQGKSLIKRLNKSVATTYEEVFKNKRGRAEAVDSEIHGAITRLTRRLDERAELKGGEEFRDDCIESLKQLSKRYDEWRAK